jgi:hypothetical protein
MELFIQRTLLIYDHTILFITQRLQCPDSLENSWPVSRHTDKSSITKSQVTDKAKMSEKKEKLIQETVKILYLEIH